MDDHYLASLIITLFVGIIILIVALNSYLRSLKISNFTDKYVLITGCDTGIGNGAAKRLDRLGFHVFATCLSANSVKELASECSDRLVPLQMDVTNEESVRKALAVVKEVLPEGRGLWTLINNAGVVGPVGLCAWFPKSKFEEPVNVNLLGTVRVTTTFLPLVRQAKGRIVVTASVVGRFAAFPGPYTVSKYCLEGYTDWLRFQLLTQGLSVHTVEPGGHNSAITHSDGHISSLEKEFDLLSGDMKAFYGEGLKNKWKQILTLACTLCSWFKVDTVVDQYVHAVTSRYPKIRYVIGWDAHFFYRPLWSVPTWMSDLLIGSLYPLPKGCA